MIEVALLAIAALVILLTLGVPLPYCFGAGLMVMYFLGDVTMKGNMLWGFQQLGNPVLLAIPLFVLAGTIMSESGIAASLLRFVSAFIGHIRGGLGVVAAVSCAVIGAISGSGLTGIAAIGPILIPEMEKRGYPREYATALIANSSILGLLIPPSVTMIVYGIATETSIGRLFLAGIIPGLLLTGLFIAWAIFATWRSGNTAVLSPRHYSLRERFEILPRILPFLLVIAGVLYAMYGGIATTSETAAVGAVLCLIMAIIIYRLWNPRAIWGVLRDSTRESVMILFIMAAAGVFAYMMSSLFITQSIAQWIAGLDVNRWVLMGLINVFLLIAGFFLPPVAVILMTAPILMPILEAAQFDPYWFAVILTINMEVGLITPPVGLNLFVINSIAPNISLRTILMGSAPFVGCMFVAIVILCIFPGLATWLPTLVMGPI